MTSNRRPLADDDLTELLQTRAERIAVHPDLDAVIEPAPQSSIGQHQTWAPWAAAAAVLFVGLLGGASLIRTPADTVVNTNSGNGLSQDLLESAAHAGPGQELLVWMNPDATSKQIQAVALVLADITQVNEYLYSDSEATYDEFAQYYADSPEVIELVDPEQLPTYFIVTTTAPSDVIDQVETLPGVNDAELAE